MNENLDDVAELPSLVTYQQTAAWADVSERHLYNMIKRGCFPKPVSFGPRTPRFRRSDLLTWLNLQSQGETDA